ncbi:uncharacterized protein LOC131952975 [Physella acuta]|uniref:uncharacterized protein LOC131952975 n=1 Tax=Physella acuta TaxID=109671 RepID=UPI0027DE9B9F|nr:uncharacterized protein LOC131952975 [Physella acuta]
MFVLSLFLVLDIVQSSSFSHSIFTVIVGSRNITIEGENLKSFLKCLRCDKVSRCTADIFNNSSGSSYRIKTVGKDGNNPIETFRTCSKEGDTLICKNLQTPTLTCVRNITILNSSLIDDCPTPILSLNINESQLRFNLDRKYFNITSCETLNVSLRTLTTPQTTTTVPISDSHSTVGIIVGAIIVCVAVIICCFLWRRRANRGNKSTTAETEHHHYFEIELDASIQHKKRKKKTESNMGANSVNPYAITPCNGYTSSNLDNKSNDTHKHSAFVSKISLKNDITKGINTDNYHAHYYSMPKDETDADICCKDINHKTVLDTHVDACKTDSPKTYTCKTDSPKTDTCKTETPKTDTCKTDTSKTDTCKTDTPKTDTCQTHLTFTPILGRR